MSQDSYLKCAACGRESTTNFASSLRTGWEKCCGYTMRLERTEADIGDAVGQCFGSVPAVIAATKQKER
jgi:hypothetical protein